MTRAVLDLKNPKNHRKNIPNLMDDILNEAHDQTEPESVESEKKFTKKTDNDEYLKEYDDIDPADRLFEESPSKFDKKEAIPNNSGDMTPFATFTSLAWTNPDKHHELISHALRKAIIIILVAMAFLSLLWQGSILTALTFFALAVVTSMHFWREAREEKYEIHPHGVMVGDSFHHYHDLDSFWIHYHPEGFHELSLCTGRFLNHYIKVPLKDQDPLEIRAALMQYLPEKKHEEGLEDFLRRRLGL